MSMTTLLTLSSMFNALTNITPPISYVTKLDIWMVLCIGFVFSTLLEFTVVIFLKYYLRHLPTFQFKHQQQQSRSQARSDKNRVFDVRSSVQAWLKVTIQLCNGKITHFCLYHVERGGKQPESESGGGVKN